MAGKILIIDDEPDMLVMLEMLITNKTPHEVVSTNNPLEIEELLTRHDFNLVITDLKMPVLDGIEVLEIVKKKDPDIPVIVITAFTGAPMISSPSRSARNKSWWPWRGLLNGSASSRKTAS